MDAPSEGRPADPARDLRVVREGSAIARWYLTGHDHLGDDVVDLLARDDDPVVVAALAARDKHRRFAREQGQP
ncbi:hypothetical protein WDZ17_13700 [Pseudokineococcus basanitobsidens]|uniref:Uncharacterized protein n=1 Tax=Pseudokineococcus basanitobsidens TaxID=1926649 RepID=A0ABU8RML7_9ACTN